MRSAHQPRHAADQQAAQQAADGLGAGEPAALKRAAMQDLLKPGKAQYIQHALGNHRHADHHEDRADRAAAPHQRRAFAKLAHYATQRASLARFSGNGALAGRKQREQRRRDQKGNGVDHHRAVKAEHHHRQATQRRRDQAHQLPVQRQQGVGLQQFGLGHQGWHQRAFGRHKE